MIYLDNAATSRVNDIILDDFIEINKSFFANASSNHKLGFEASKLLNASREQILNLLNLDDKYEVIFNSGATEGNNEAIKGVAFGYANRGKHLITSKAEHPSVLETFKQLHDVFGYDVTYLDVYEDGNIHLEDLKSAIREDTILVSLMAVNNEIGSIEDIKGIAEIIKSHPKIFFHSDTTQAIGKILLPYEDIDLFVISGHKINGLKGSGALIKRKNIKLMPLANGGGQEYGYRSGTSNVASNVLLAKTLRLFSQDFLKKQEYIKKLHDTLCEKLDSIEGIVMNSPMNGSPYIVNFSFLKHKASVIVEGLSNKDIMVSTTSACSSKAHQASHVLKAMNKDIKVASNSLRVSFCHQNTMEEIDEFISALKELMQNIKK